MQNSDITIYGDGEQVRDFIYVEDLVAAIAHLIENSEAYSENTFNIGYGKYISINELASQIVQKSDSSSKLLYEPERPGDIKLSYASINNLLNSGWQPHIGFEEGLQRTIDWFKKII